MDTSFIIYAVIGVIVVSLVVTAIIQQREQIAAAKKQKATQFIYKSRNAEEILEKVMSENINPEILNFLMGLIVRNYKSAAKTCPGFNNIQQLLSRAIIQLNDFKPSASSNSVSVTDEEQLRSHVAKLNKLYSYLKNQTQSGTLSADRFKIWGQQLKAQSNQFEIDGLIKLCLRAIEAAMPGTAKNHLEAVENKLKTYPLDSAYLAQRSTDLENIKLQLKGPTDEQDEDEEDDRPLDEKTKW